MDIDAIRSLVTAVGLTCFLSIVLWAYSKRARKGFDEAAMLPFNEEGDEALKAVSGGQSWGQAS